MLAQVHTHPGDFGHSPGDERNAVCFKIGFISIVVPNFAAPDTDFDDFYVYSYCEHWKWHLFSSAEVKKQFIVADSIIRI